MGRDPWVAIEATIRRNGKIAGLSGDSARWAWIVTLAEAKLQRPQGQFASRAVYAEALGRLSRYGREHLAAGLLELAPAICVRCRGTWGDPPQGVIVVHDWAQHQRDPGAAERVATWREERRANAADTQNVRPPNERRTANVRRTYDKRTADVTGDSRARGETETETESESRVPSAVPRRAHEGTRPKKVEGFTTPGEVDWHQTLDRRQLAAWASFGAEWEAMKRAWLARGLRYPPAGSAEDDPEAEAPSPRAMLWQVLDARPGDLPRWIAEAPRGATASGVIGYVLERWHAARDEATERANGEESRWGEAKADDAATAGVALEQLGAVAAGSS